MRGPFLGPRIKAAPSEDSRARQTKGRVAYQVLARKWRPQSFAAVVGQDAITRTLRNALVAGRLAHAYLFAGPRGIGKTTTARLLAKALLCPERKLDELSKKIDNMATAGGRPGAGPEGKGETEVVRVREPTGAEGQSGLSRARAVAYGAAMNDLNSATFRGRSVAFVRISSPIVDRADGP